MPRAVDRLPLPVTHDPNQSLEFHVRMGLAKGTELWQLILDAIREHAEDLVRKLLQGLMQLPATVDQALEELYALLPDWLTELPGKVVEFINTHAGINLASWDALLDSLEDGKGIDLALIPQFVRALEGIPWESGDPGAILRAIANAAGQFLRNLLPSWLPQVSLFSIGTTQPNLLLEGSFQTAATLDGGGFHWNGDDGRTEDGCAALICDGEDHVLVSNLIPVSEGQEVLCGGFVTHAGVSGADCIKIELNTYLGESPVSTVLVESLTPAGDSTDWSTELSGGFTVPAGVDMVALQLHVTSAATAGVVQFDDCWVKKQQLLQIPFVSGLVSQLASLLSNIQGIIDRVVNAFENLGEFIDTNFSIDKVLDTVFGLLDGILTNSSITAAQGARIRALESAANTITLDFNGGSSSNPGAGFTVSSSGGGSGAMGLNGKGALVWKPAGAGNRTQIARYTPSALATNNCVLNWVLSSSPQSYIFDDAYTYVCARMNGVTDYLRVRSGYDQVRVQAVVGGAVSNVGGVWSGNPKAGDEFEWHIGEPGDTANRHHVLKRNGVTILDFSETTSVFGPTRLHVGCGMETGNRLVITQNIPAGLSVLTAAEVL